VTEYNCLQPPEIDRFLERRRTVPAFTLELSLTENLQAILRKANEFVPSAAGAILLDNPAEKSPDRSKNTLVFIAAFGERSRNLLGRRIAAESGVPGKAYLAGTSCVADSAPGWLAEADDGSASEKGVERPVVAVPLRIEQDICGVLELERRPVGPAYSSQDLTLLEIFGDYISVSIQNVLDGRQAQKIAKRDELSGLYNDRYLHIALSHVIAECLKTERELALLFVDLDFFKRVNDTYGHLAGSQVLREVGQMLNDLVDLPQALAARYGGDEFVIAVPDASLEESIELAESIRLELVDRVLCSAPGEIQSEPLHLRGLTCSIGVATLRRHIGESVDPEQAKNILLRLSDAAMYVAKETGRNRTAVAGEPVRRRAVPH
jgi:diguanylate cyclase (GGDEF)-like protein